MLKMFKDFDLKKASKEALRLSLAKAQLIRALIVASIEKVYNLLKRSIQSIQTLFYRWSVKACSLLHQWSYKQFKQPKGIAFVGGLEHAGLIQDAFVKIVNKNPKTRLFSLSSVLQFVDSPPQIKLLIPDITSQEMEQMDKILRVYLTPGENVTIPDAFDLIRGFLGPTYLLQKFFKKDVFTVFIGILSPEEIELLRKERYYLVYIQSNDMKSRWERGYTYCSTYYDLSLFNEITEMTIMNIFKTCGLKLS